MRELTRGVFEHLETTYALDFDKIVNYTQRILRLLELKKYKTFLAECKESVKGFVGDQWTLGMKKYVTMEKLWTWEKLYGVNEAGDVYLGAYRCLKFEK